MTLDKLIEELKEIEKLQGGDTPVYFEGFTIDQVSYNKEIKSVIMRGEENIF